MGIKIKEKIMQIRVIDDKTLKVTFFMNTKKLTVVQELSFSRNISFVKKHCYLMSLNSTHKFSKATTFLCDSSCEIFLQCFFFNNYSVNFVKVAHIHFHAYQVLFDQKYV